MTDVANAFVDFLHTPDAQGPFTDASGSCGRPTSTQAQAGDPANGFAADQDLFTADDLGGWDAARHRSCSGRRHRSPRRSRPATGIGRSMSSAAHARRTRSRPGRSARPRSAARLRGPRACAALPSSISGRMVALPCRRWSSRRDSATGSARSRDALGACRARGTAIRLTLDHRRRSRP